MENIIHRLENIKLVCNYELNVFRDIPSIVNYQKCLLPLKLMTLLNVTPGDVIIINYRNTKYIVKAFQSFPHINKLEICGIVECGSEDKCEQYVIEKIESLAKFTSVEVDLVCESSHVSFWLTKKNKFLQILDRRILRNLLLCDDSVVSFDKFPNAISQGLRKIIIHTGGTNGVGFINSRTKITIQKIISEAQYQSNKLSQIHFFGFDRIVEELTQMVDLNIEHLKMTNKLLPPIKQVLVAGPSGSGKSSLVHQISSIKHYPLVKIIGYEIHSKDPGQSEKILRDIVNEAFLYSKSEGICMLLLEDIDIICPKGKNTTPHTARLSSQLMLLLDKCQESEGIVVIATTNKPTNIHAGLRRHGRLAKEIILGKPSESDRAKIICEYLNIFGCFSREQIFEIGKTIANITPGYLGGDLKLLCQTACSKQSKIDDKHEKVKTFIKSMKEILLEMKPASLRNDVEVISSGTTIHLGGLADVRKQLELSVHCSLLQPHIYTRMGIQKPRGILLYGPPGCAKTSLAKSLASKGSITVLYATNASIYSPYVGDAEKAIVSLFRNARQNAPAVIFIDEIDSLVGSRSDSFGSNDVQERVLAALLTQMDGIGIAKDVADENEEWADGDGVMVVAATNRPNEIDPALLRPGRFDRHIHVPPPNLEDRLEILSLVSKNTPLDENVDLKVIAEKTKFFSGADLKNLHKEAVLYAMKNEGINIAKIRQSHYEEVLKIIKPSLNKDIVNNFRNLF